MGKAPEHSSLGNFPGPSSYSVVAPFAAAMDNIRARSVKYTQFITSDYRVNEFIRSETGNSFYGTRMLVAEWNGVPKYQGSIVSCTCNDYVVYIYIHGQGGNIIKYKYGWNAEGGCSVIACYHIWRIMYRKIMVFSAYIDAFSPLPPYTTL